MAVRKPPGADLDNNGQFMTISTEHPGGFPIGVRRLWEFLELSELEAFRRFVKEFFELEASGAVDEVSRGLAGVIAEKLGEPFGGVMEIFVREGHPLLRLWAGRLVTSSEQTMTTVPVMVHAFIFSPARQHAMRQAKIGLRRKVMEARYAEMYFIEA